jgi:hypothetical protein
MSARTSTTSSRVSVPAQPTSARKSERFRKFPLETLLTRDKLNLDMFWLKDDTLDDPDLLHRPTKSRPRRSRAWRRRWPAFARWRRSRTAYDIARSAMRKSGKG